MPSLIVWGILALRERIKKSPIDWNWWTWINWSALFLNVWIAGYLVHTQAGIIKILIVTIGGVGINYAALRLALALDRQDKLIYRPNKGECPGCRAPQDRFCCAGCTRIDPMDPCN